MVRSYQIMSIQYLSIFNRRLTKTNEDETSTDQNSILINDKNQIIKKIITIVRK